MARTVRSKALLTTALVMSFSMPFAGRASAADEIVVPTLAGDPAAVIAGSAPEIVTPDARPEVPASATATTAASPAPAPATTSPVEVLTVAVPEPPAGAADLATSAPLVAETPAAGPTTTATDTTTTTATTATAEAAAPEPTPDAALLATTAPAIDGQAPAVAALTPAPEASPAAPTTPPTVAALAPAETPVAVPEPTLDVGTLASIAPSIEAAPSVVGSLRAAEPDPVPSAPTVSTPATPSVTPAPAATTAATLDDPAVVAALGRLLGEARPQPTAEDRADLAGVVAFYRERDNRPLFHAEGGAKLLAGVTDRLARAEEDGLDPAHYRLPTLPAGALADDLARAEIDTAQAVVRYARHAAQGRLDPNRLSSNITVDRHDPEPVAVLKAIAGAADPSATLAAYNPPHRGYQLLRAELGRLIGTTPVAAVEAREAPIPPGPTIRPGSRDERVALLRERFDVATATDAEVYDPALVAAVTAFQRSRGLPATGNVGPQTVAALNGGLARPESGGANLVADIKANMERWRWLPRDLGAHYVFVNVPEFTLFVKNGYDVTHRARVVVGKPETQTPIFSDMMDHVVVNPFWNVPQSIIRKEMMGRAQSSAGSYFNRGNYEVFVGSRKVDPTTVDWTQVRPGAVSVRQRPGGGNALGNVKFMFPNNHSVYIHDTSSRGLFAQDYRALSHGCVRVHEPFVFANALLSGEPSGMTGEQLRRMVGPSGERTVRLQRHIPVHIAYFTTFVDDDGRLQSRADLYGHNARLKRALGL